MISHFWHTVNDCNYMISNEYDFLTCIIFKRILANLPAPSTAIVCTHLNVFKYCEITQLFQSNINNLFALSQMVSSIVFLH